MCVAAVDVAAFKCRPVLPLLLGLMLCTVCSDGCLQTAGYRNFWAELYSTTPCGESGGVPMGVCSLRTTCSVMAGEALGAYNCPLTSGTCCRPVASCDTTSVALNLLWQSGNYEIANRLRPSQCQLTVVPSADTCYIRADFTDLDIQSTRINLCDDSYLQIKEQFHGDSPKLCGTLNHKSTFVKVGTSIVGLPVPIIFHLVMNHVPHKYSIKFNHIKCSDVETFNKRRHYNRALSLEDDTPRTSRMRARKDGKELPYLGRLYAVSYTHHPLIRSCPVTFITKDIVIGPASCSLRLGGPGTSKGLMVVHGAPHNTSRTSYPSSVGGLAKYVAANGIVVKSTVFHPMYNHATHENDIAVYFLNKTVYAVTPVELPVPIDDFVDLSVYMARYRYHEMSDEVTIMTHPEEKATSIISNTECVESSLPAVAGISSNNTLCIAATPRDEAPCEGEVGTPIVHIGGSGTVTVLGLLLGGYHHCEGPHSYPEPALKIISYLDFIDVATSPEYTIPPFDTPATAIFTRLYNSILG